MLKVGQSLLHKSFGHPLATPSTDRYATSQFLSTACSAQYSELRQSFSFWVDALGGLAAPIRAEGGAT